MNDQPLGGLQRGPFAHMLGGVLIFGWRTAPAAQVLWPANNDPAQSQGPQKIINACVGFETEGALHFGMSWDHAVFFDVSQDCYHQFLLARRKAFIESSHGAAP